MMDLERFLKWFGVFAFLTWMTAICAAKVVVWWLTTSVFGGLLR